MQVQEGLVGFVHVVFGLRLGFRGRGFRDGLVHVVCGYRFFHNAGRASQSVRSGLDLGFRVQGLGFRV
jgi:hypothetical protein